MGLGVLIPRPETELLVDFAEAVRACGRRACSLSRPGCCRAAASGRWQKASAAAVGHPHNGHKFEAQNPTLRQPGAAGSACARRARPARSGKSPAAPAQALAARPELRGGAWADLGTGSGALAVGLARLLPPGARVLAVECSARARAWAELNVRRLGLQAAVEVRRAAQACSSGLAGMRARSRVSG